jgi:hypothetical protein
VDQPGSDEHRAAARKHLAEAERHTVAAEFWAARGDAERTAVEQREGWRELDAASAELDRAELLDRLQ